MITETKMVCRLALMEAVSHDDIAKERSNQSGYSEQQE